MHLGTYLLLCLTKKICCADYLDDGTKRYPIVASQNKFCNTTITNKTNYSLLSLLIFSGLNPLVKIKHDPFIRSGLIAISVFTILVSYLIKIKIIF